MTAYIFIIIYTEKTTAPKKFENVKKNGRMSMKTFCAPTASNILFITSFIKLTIRLFSKNNVRFT